MPVRLGTLTHHLTKADTGQFNASRGIVRTTDGEAIEAYVKVLSDPRHSLVETVCAILGRSLGLPIPEPMLVLVTPEHGGPALAFGSAVIDAPNFAVRLSGPQAKAAYAKLKGWKDLLHAACFDEWIANADRHAGNVLFDGKDGFWLIDHNLALHETVHPDAHAVDNMLFNVVIEAQEEPGLLETRGRAREILGSFAAMDPAMPISQLPHGFWAIGLIRQIELWLKARQPHLVNLGCARVPAEQNELTFK